MDREAGRTPGEDGPRRRQCCRLAAVSDWLIVKTMCHAGLWHNSGSGEIYVTIRGKVQA